MAMKRFPITNVNDIVGAYRNPDEKLYASLELNQVAFPKTGMVVSQSPLGDDFADAPCENGMWVVADKSGDINAPAADGENAPIGIVYTAQKEYDIMHYGLQRFGRKFKGDYPRVGLLGVGDTVTTNCLKYDMASEQDLWDALENIAEEPLYVAIDTTGTGAENAVPAIVDEVPETGIYGKIVKFYTVPNGGKGVKYQIMRV